MGNWFSSNEEVIVAQPLSETGAENIEKPNNVNNLLYNCLDEIIIVFIIIICFVVYKIVKKYKNRIEKEAIARSRAVGLDDAQA